ncbi:chemotaxis protein CheA [Paenibacillus hemerocallicola]|uniref:Chemotaxis protein CheA n=1 Tax=Paenibacillus hemerocallicola TaxID=1172614 RepID=A0A5C4TEA0_9BACL|nr:chemotaxis protein CheA [Paenibacillus hemerocallicola]TNJ66847.1 chemotaxis protein CheA [Paenibacillus hemerocallicola]
MNDMSVYREAFMEELADQLERIEQDLLAIEQQVTEPLVQSIFRAAHTIKGSSAAMEFGEMKLLTHEMEHLLDLVRGRRLDVDDALIELLFQALDLLKRLRDQYANGGPYADINGMLAGLRGFVQDKDEALPQIALPELTPEQSERAADAVRSGHRLLAVQIRLAEECPMKGARFYLIADKIAGSIGPVVMTDPPLPTEVQGEDADYGTVRLLIGSRTEAARVKRDISADTDVQKVQAIEYKLVEPAVETLSETFKESSAVPEERQKQGAQTIRVSVERLEQLMNLVGELLIDQTSLAELKRTAYQRFPHEEFTERLSDVSDHMARIVGELQESVMKARMLPIEHMFNRFPRMVRDLSRNLGKEIELVLDGTETELDRTLIEEIGDPLIHLVRNALDHGIEAPEVRTGKGKPEQGRVRLNSYHEDNQVVITVEDDGAGIRPEIIKQSAVRKGLVTEEQAGRLTEQEAVHLIFQPGFSTASAVSEISGRGVGMDIVRNQIERLNGLISIRTAPDEGTCFTIRLPLTLAIITGLMVKVSERDYVIPMNNVSEIVRIPRDKIQKMQGDNVILIRDQVIPLVPLHEIMGYPAPASLGKNVPVVIIGSMDKKVALAVDETIGNQEIVIKTLPPMLGKLEHVAGATILGNGRVALILEAAYFVKLRGRRYGA